MQTAVASGSGAYWQWRGQTIYYVKAGVKAGDSLEEQGRDRPPLLLVHGFGASTDHWRKNIAGLSRYFEVWANRSVGLRSVYQGRYELWRYALARSAP